MTVEAPNRIPWPPLIYISAAVAGYVLGQLIPTWSIDVLAVRAIGAGLIFCALTLDVLTVLAFRKHRTTIMPHRAASTLITTGPFAFVRNPIYLANTMLLAGVGLGFDYVWMVILALPAAYLTQKLAIEREEQHLAKTFGDAWHTYTADVPRWLPLL